MELDRAQKPGSTRCRTRGQIRRKAAGRARRRYIWLLGIVLLAGAGARAAEDAPPPQVDLDRLLRLPRSYDASVPRYGGATQAEWRERFAKAQRDVDLASVALEEVEEELKSLANESSQWQVSAPGQTQSSETSPLSFRLREEIRKQREEVAQARKRERSLDIEADLADVPEEWREMGTGEVVRQ